MILVFFVALQPAIYSLIIKEVQNSYFLPVNRVTADG